ncbi:MAG: hypothetical protein KAH44_20875 [Oricola sp.]|uniref:hypothetical protein n=1 Tax=Hyphococcus sp. TaxID=2038636 RepID=UPI00320BBD97|nr:hypothetical protein [Oricola sp.]
MSALLALSVSGFANEQKQPGGADATSIHGASQTTTVPTVAAFFDEASLVTEPRIVNCTLSGGTQTKCLSLTVKLEPATFEIGPWCPRNLEDGSDVSGIWLENGRVYDADGAFIQNLSSFYHDDNWRMYDPETGRINVTDTEVSCRAAARPDVAAFSDRIINCIISKKR